ncbi:DUF5631 domain-containing protein [Mycolicibacterium rhodesiae]|uniref:Vegetative cell wall protein n=1 Tax=Mycolicibacterium rhodesiae TaxID=36814 RepID=A0A1X0IIU2_MYCRH|nr:DUF5631 domain-containing protein [Mycolicibacterium rhodesiae]MCV7343948.1 DUF5631 domain-containing protein [Mycolicibacterium rhodesiae]ORB47326.1 hypothetical protein BST42_28000 [Mycolicibacterium rhodesiae]
MAIFGRNTARQRLKRATRQALSAPAFDTPPDATPWVIGGLWPAELETVTPATAAVAAHLKNDLQRIADSANERLRALSHADVPDFARRTEEVRIIETARAYAVQRVESTIRQLRSAEDDFDTDPAMPKITPEQVHEVGVIPAPLVEPVEINPAPEPPPAPAPAPEPEPEPGDRQLETVLEFVARQEPGLRWAVGERADGTTVLVTDLAHGWIPPGIAVPAGLGLLPPARRGGRVGELLGDVVRSAVYHPGDPFGAARPDAPTSLEARELPRVDDLGWKLVEATHWRDGLPRMVHTLAKAGAARTGILDAEVDVLRVHSDTARYQLMAQYPDVDAALLSNCLLLAATEAIALGDEVSANYHMAWFEALTAPQPTNWGTAP